MVLDMELIEWLSDQRNANCGQHEPRLHNAGVFVGNTRPTDYLCIRLGTYFFPQDFCPLVQIIQPLIDSSSNTSSGVTRPHGARVEVQ